MNTKKTPFEIKTNINYTNKVKGKNHKSDEIYGVCKILHVSSVQRKHLQKLMKQRLAQGQVNKEPGSSSTEAPTEKQIVNPWQFSFSIRESKAYKGDSSIHSRRRPSSIPEEAPSISITGLQQEQETTIQNTTPTPTPNLKSKDFTTALKSTKPPQPIMTQDQHCLVSSSRTGEFDTARDHPLKSPQHISKIKTQDQLMDLNDKDKRSKSTSGYFAPNKNVKSTSNMHSMPKSSQQQRRVIL